jgi:hypothetical protein
MCQQLRYSAEILSFWQQQQVPGKVPDPVNGGDYLLERQELQMGFLQDGASQLQLTVQPARVVGPVQTKVTTTLKWNYIETTATYASSFRLN